jgi:hypothetical protein
MYEKYPIRIDVIFLPVSPRTKLLLLSVPILFLWNYMEYMETIHLKLVH